MITERLFGTTTKGEKVSLFVLENSRNVKAEILSYGGRVRALFVPDRNGKLNDVVLGYDTIAEYENDSAYLGALIGRNSNRIKKAETFISGKKYTFDKNDGENNLHSGDLSFDEVVWAAEINGEKLVLSHTAKNGEGGFPGNLKVTVRYTLTEDNELKIEYFAVSDDDTIANFTNHSYFNLSGHDSGEITNQMLQINADFISAIDSDCLQTGEILSVKNTPFDFKTPKKIGRDIDVRCEQLNNGNGYDHNYILKGNGFRQVAVLSDENSGICMQVFTDMPCMQLYSGNFLDGTVKGKNGATHIKRSAVCLETQKYPDAENVQHFPSSVLKKGEEYKSMTVYKFLVRQTLN